ncbi:unnamed protein product [marine sediment metagenome]|uniref:Methyltransferase domain-containing protein n=1 Tax=marine sediment metagenome TaxID=412755 RepID=X1CTC2_9ZZZZ
MRPSLDVVKDRFKCPIIGAEIGVARGGNALSILQNMPNVKLLYLVDPYMKYEGFAKSPMANIVASLKEVAKQCLSSFNDRIIWVYKRFEECTSEEIKNPLDFIYIDNNHDYEYVKSHIVLGVQFVKPGGVVSGHDYSRKYVGLRKAVDEYSEKHHLELFKKNGDWWFIRP